MPVRVRLSVLQDFCCCVEIVPIVCSLQGISFISFGSDSGEIKGITLLTPYSVCHIPLPNAMDKASKSSSATMITRELARVVCVSGLQN